MTYTIRTLNTDDLKQLHAIRQIAFGETRSLSDPEVKAQYLRRLPYLRGLFVAKRLASAMSMLPFEVYYGSKVIHMGGLASVLTAAEYRRRGYVKALLQHELERLRQEGIGLSLEYPFDPHYYARFGWQTIPNGIVAAIPSRLLLSKHRPDVSRLDETDLERCQRIYHDWAQHYHFTMLRNASFRDDWSNLLHSAEAQPRRLLYGLEDAYCVISFSREGQESSLTVHDYAFRSPAGRKNLQAFLGSMEGQVEVIKMRLPSDDPLLLDKQPYLQASQHLLQARIVDAKVFLESCMALHSGQFSMHIEDDFCSWNQGSYQVNFAPEGVMVTAYDGEADITLDIRTLALILAGGSSVTSCWHHGLMKGKREAAEQLAALAGSRVSFQGRNDAF